MAPWSGLTFYDLVLMAYSYILSPVSGLIVAFFVITIALWLARLFVMTVRDSRATSEIPESNHQSPLDD